MSAQRLIGRRITRIAFAVALVASALLTGAGPATAQAPDEVLSHFLCYKGTFAPFDAVPNILFQDDFGVRTTTVARPHLFCNPVRKTRRDTVTKIVDRTQHLKAYRLRTAPTDQFFPVVSNQFGKDQILTIENVPSRTLVPTRKLPHDAPVGLDHFACYDVKDGRAIDRRVQLKDQFISIATRVGTPAMLCMSATKTHVGGPTFPREHPGANLLCYLIGPRRLDPPVGRRTANQFERARVKSEVAVQLCVPSEVVLV
jgi:hypothetical protein